MNNEMILLYLYIFFIGCCFGSFFNLCIYRIPRKESIVFPGSHCTSCNKRLRPVDLIPIISYLLSGGKCRYCKARYSARYLIMEAVWGLIFVLPFYKYQLSINTLIGITLLSFLLLTAMLHTEKKLLLGERAKVYSNPIFIGFLIVLVLMLL